MFSFSNARYSAPDNSSVDVMIVMNSGDKPLPFTAVKNGASTSKYYDAIVSAGDVAPYTPPVLTLAQQASNLIKSGLTISLTGSTTLEPTLFSTDSSIQTWISDENLSISLSSVFLDGQPTVQWPDASGKLHEFNIAQFKSVASAIISYVGLCRKCISGISTTLPSNNITLTV
jgi:hypothetical protein